MPPVRIQNCYCENCRGKAVGVKEYKRHRQAQLAALRVAPSTISPPEPGSPPQLVRRARAPPRTTRHDSALRCIFSVDPLLKKGSAAMHKDNLCKFVHPPNSASLPISDGKMRDNELMLVPKSILALHEREVTKAACEIQQMIQSHKRPPPIYLETMAIAASSLASRISLIQEKKVSDWETTRFRESLSPLVKVIDTGE